LKNDKGKEDFSHPVGGYPPYGKGILRHIRPKAEPHGGCPIRMFHKWSCVESIYKTSTALPIQIFIVYS
jgi:hypothetical protein